VLNALTTKTKIKTIVRIQATRCEFFMLCTSTLPEALRISLSQALSTIRQARATANRPEDGRAESLVNQLAKLATMLENGLLTRDEFERMKAAVISKARS
jgi:Short C-terminal domain